MKKILLLLFTSLLWVGCSPEDNEQEKDATNGVVPLAPSNLVAESNISSEAELEWTDNSTNESGFKIERKASGQNYAVVGTVGADIMNYEDLELQNGEEYTYRVYSYNATGKSLTYTNEVTVKPTGTPIIETSPVVSITGTSAVSGGKVTDNAGATITETGVVWSTNPDPEITSSAKTVHYSGEHNFESHLTDLQPETTYYARAYAVNQQGVGYGEEIDFTTAQLPLKTYKITIEGLLDGNYSNYPDPTINSFKADYLFDDQHESMEYSEPITNEVWVEKSKSLSARNQVGVKLYIEQEHTFLTYLVFEIEDLDSGEIIFRGDVGSGTVVAPSSEEDWADNASDEIKIIYDIANKEMNFSY